jgi:branched-chain amino acid transport system substrate-binding protein
MTGPLKIGFLSPYSGVYPYYAQHLMAGMLLGIYPGAIKKNEIQFIPVYTKMGDPKSVLEATNRLVFFDQCDIISGLISYQSIPDILPVIERYNKIGFFFDLGEYIPWFDYLSPRLFYSSQQIWQSQYALGYWAGKQYGEGGMMAMTIYEAGYHVSSVFHKGVRDAGAGHLDLQVIKDDRNNPKAMDLDVFFAAVQKKAPAFVHAIFVGDQGNEFLLAWKNSGYHKQIPLIVVENMAYDDVLGDAAGLDLEIISASTWSRADENSRNQAFVKRFESQGGQTANIFGLLGYEAGLALREVKALLLKRDMARVAELLQKESVIGPRGDRNFYPSSGFSLPEIDILNVKTSVNNIFKTIISQGKGLKFDAENFNEIHDGCVSGWQNPYMCI